MQSMLDDSGALQTSPASARRTLFMSRPGKLLASAFIIYYLVAVFTWLLPASTLRDTLSPAVSEFMLFTGLWQGWDMFSPDPDKTNAYVTANITYRNGQIRTYEFPRMPKLSYWERYQKERFRKWGMERARIDDYRFCWPDAARWVARINNTQPGNPPVYVALIRHWYFVPPPTGDLSKPIPHHYNSYQYFTLSIRPEDLQ